MGLVDEVNVMLARTLFWFFGHPLVYFWLLPAYVMYYSYMSKLAGGKLYSDMAGRLVFFMFIDHSDKITLLDKDGNIRRHYQGSELRSEDVVMDIRTLLDTL